jgi:hypothetical protein
MKLVFNVDSDGLLELVAKKRIQPMNFNIPREEQHKLMMENKLFAEDVVDGQVVRWNPAKDRDPRIKENENAGNGKGGFRFSPYYHEKGKFLQDVIKKGIIKAIEVAHDQIVGRYDPEAYKLDDGRLRELNAYMRAYLSYNFEHQAPRKITFMSQILDIVMFLMKEDIYYRARFLDMWKNMPRDYELTQEELENINKWH